jgi:hypothetical protein
MVVQLHSDASLVVEGRIGQLDGLTQGFYREEGKREREGAACGSNLGRPTRQMEARDRGI